MTDFISLGLIKQTSNKLDNTISIKDYPMIFPEADDTSRLQRLFNDIGTKGKNIILTKGTYLVSSTINITNKDSFAIIGNKDATIKRASMFTGGMIKMTQCSDFMIKGLHIDTDDGFGTPAKVVGTYNANATTYNVDSTTGYKSSGSFYVYTTAGIQSVSYTGKTTTSFTGCVNYGVIGGGGMSSPVTTGSDIRPIYSSPLHLIGVSDFDITQNSFTGNFNHAASDMVSIEAIVTETTTSQGYKTYVASTPTNNGKIYQNTFKNSGEEAVIFRHGCSNIQVNNNYFENVWGTGVTNKGHKSEVSFNTFVNCYIGTEVNGEANIWTQGHKATVKGNKFYNCGIPVFMQTTGANLETAGKFVQTYIVQNNEMYDSTFCAIYGRHGNEAIIENNRIEGVILVADPRTPPYGAGNGIYLFNVHNSNVTENKIINTTNEQIWIDSCYNFKAKDNRTRQGGLFTKTTGTFNADATTYTVETTSGYADSGSFKVSVGGVEQTISYSGKTAISFTGCVGGDTSAVATGSFVRDVGTKRHVYINTCNDYEFANNKVNNGFITIHSAKHSDIVDNKIVNVDATAGILVTGDSYRSRFNRNRVVYARQYGIKLDGTGRIQEYNEIDNNNIMYSSSATNGGTSAIQLVNNLKPSASNNTILTDLANKPTYGVELMSTTSNAVALNNKVTGFTGSVPVKDWNTTTPNSLQTLSKFGTVTYSADGNLGSYTFAHGLNPLTPAYVNVLLSSTDAGTAGIKYVTADATNIYVYYVTKPVAGTNNISLKWEAKI